MLFRSKPQESGCSCQRARVVQGFQAFRGRRLDLLGARRNGQEKLAARDQQAELRTQHGCSLLGAAIVSGPPERRSVEGRAGRAAAESRPGSQPLNILRPFSRPIRIMPRSPRLKSPAPHLPPDCNGEEPTRLDRALEDPDHAHQARPGHGRAFDDHLRPSPRRADSSSAPYRLAAPPPAADRRRSAGMTAAAGWAASKPRRGRLHISWTEMHRLRRPGKVKGEVDRAPGRSSADRRRADRARGRAGRAAGDSRPAASP